MSAKITGYSTPEPLVPLKGSNGGLADKVQSEAATSATSAASSTQTGDQLTLTSSARSLQKLSDVIAQAPVVDSTKVAAIKQALGSGTYRIDAKSVAGKLLQLDGELK